MRGIRFASAARFLTLRVSSVAGHEREQVEPPLAMEISSAFQFFVRGCSRVPPVRSPMALIVHAGRSSRDDQSTYPTVPNHRCKVLLRINTPCVPRPCPRGEHLSSTSFAGSAYRETRFPCSALHMTTCVGMGLNGAI